MTRAQKYAWAAAVVVAALAAYAFYSTFRYVEKEVSLPPRGEARYNPLYALGESLKRIGQRVESRAVLQWETMAPEAGDVIVLASPLSSLSAEQAWTLQDWVYEGGYLLFAASATQSESESVLLEEFGLQVTRESRQCLRWSADVDGSSAVACAELALSYPHDDLIWQLPYQQRSWRPAELSQLLDLESDDHDAPIDDETEHDQSPGDSALDGEYEVEPDHEQQAADSEAADTQTRSDGGRRPVEGQYALKAAFGDGEWIALANLDALTGKAMDHPAKGALAWQLFGPWLGEGKVHLIYAVNMPPAHVLLVRHGWPVLIPLLLALFAWLWARSQSFGPPLPVPESDRRALLEHIDAAGQFAFRQQLVEPLYQECRKRFDQQLEKEHPSLAALPLGDKIRALAERWQLDPVAVAQALNPLQLARADQFVLAIRTLTQMQGLS